MHDMSSFDKNKTLFLRRKHKLYKSLSHPTPSHFNDVDLVRSDAARLCSIVLNKENQASQVDYFIKHELKTDLTACMPAILEMLWGLLDVRCGRILSFAAYRMCRKYPAAYWTFLAFMAARLEDPSFKSSEQTAFLTDLYLYGFAISADQFATHLFPHFQPHVLDLLPKYFNLLQSNEFFPLRHQRTFLECFLAWMQEERLKVQLMRDQLLAQSRILQERLIAEMEDEQEELGYIRRLECYETQLFRFANAAQHLNERVDMEDFKLKSIFELKKECRTFKLSFQYSDYQKSLYLNGPAREVRPLKKSEMLRMEESEAFVTRVKLCCSVQECVELGGYFLEQLNTQHNREQLIEVIINDCYHYNNLPYVLKVVRDISLAEPSLVDYCCGKGRKICAQSRMNPKYQKLLCEMCRFALMDENILLDYCEKVVRLESSQATREVEGMLEHLGTIVYYRSLRTHTRINELFERMEAMMKGRLVQFSMEQLFHLKGLLSYLRSHANKVTPEAEDMAAVEIKTNFPFILKKMERLLKEDHPQKVLQFVAAGIDHQDFLNSYYYASLIRDLHHKPLHQQVHALALSSITASLPLLDAQRSVCWSRFLGELYNYEIISRRKLIEDLTDILQRYQEAGTLSSSLKCICATLETAKHYLKESEINRDQRQVICFLLDLKKVVCLNSIDQLLYDEIAELTEYFHPFLSHLDSIERIYSLIELADQLQQQESIYAILDLMQNGTSIEQLRNEQRHEARRRYAEKEKPLPEKAPEQKWVEKAVKYRQREPSSDPIHTAVQPARESPSKQSIKTEETREGRVQKKQIKVMGRSRGDKRVRVVTATYSQPLE